MDNIREFKFCFNDEEKIITCDVNKSIESLLRKFLLEINCPKTINIVNIQFIFRAILLNKDDILKKSIKDVFKEKRINKIIVYDCSTIIG